MGEGEGECEEQVGALRPRSHSRSRMAPRMGEELPMLPGNGGNGDGAAHNAPAAAVARPAALAAASLPSPRKALERFRGMSPAKAYSPLARTEHMPAEGLVERSPPSETTTTASGYCEDGGVQLSAVQETMKEHPRLYSTKL